MGLILDTALPLKRMDYEILRDFRAMGQEVRDEAFYGMVGYGVIRNLFGHDRGDNDHENLMIILPHLVQVEYVYDGISKLQWVQDNCEDLWSSRIGSRSRSHEDFGRINHNFYFACEDDALTFTIKWRGTT